MKERKEIIQEVRKFKLQSKKYQEYYSNGTIKRVDEIGGHVNYLERQKADSICPSGEFVDTLLKKCAQELGVHYGK